MGEASITNPLGALRKKRRKRLIWTVGVLAVALGAGGYLYFNMQSTPSFVPTAQTVQVARGDVTKTLELSGTVEATKEVNLNFTSADDTKLTAVNVKVGDVVKKGQVLATLDQSDGLVQLKESQASLEVAQAQLEQAQETASESEIAVQRVNVSKAELTLESARTATDVETAQRTVDSAKKKLDSAKQEYEDQAYLYEANAIAESELNQAKDSLDSAQEEYDNAQLELSNKQKSVDKAIKEAEISYQSSLAQLNATLEPPKAASLVSAKASVLQAQTQVEQKQADLEKLVLTAPWDGIILQVNGDVGTSPTTPFIVMNDSNSEELSVSAAVSESDIGSVEVGQSATFKSDTYPNESFEGKVTSIAPEATTDSGVTTYEVKMSISNTNGLLKTGMSMDVTLDLGTHSNVLYIPSTALITRGDQDGVMKLAGTGSSTSNSNSSGGSVDNQSSTEPPAATTPSENNNTSGNNVNKSNGGVQSNRQNAAGGVQFQPVEVGLYTADRVEITSGLKENDTITIPTQTEISSSSSTSSSSRSQQSIMGGGSFGGGPSGPPGGR
ncbi:efflux RND transporter periplasmic adaptor subunit [Paenibacillus massiliensis]|uniref:efflux RND transporter periplasmic adaptor subunit n=1 Tax=Paenibacillus massiliensis TaxID=225917 RepID=UPI000415DEC4|nr:efflux RND transporter periplasmic adaptor subunit [Paenibacillus massiliensis]